MDEREITGPIDLCAPDGTIAPGAVGWARGPVHRCRIDGPWGRRKRWHYWCVTSDREVVSLTLADLDYLGLAIVVVVDRATGASVRDVVVRPLGWRVAMPTSAGHGRVEVEHRGLRLAFVDRGAEIRLVARTRRLSVDVVATRPAGHQSLGVAVAWSATRFAYTSKQHTLPTTGAITVDGARRAIAPGAFATLDYGRGVWPATTAWNWASASGVDRGRAIGLNLGARWTDGGGATENALCVDGHLRKLSSDVRFAWSRRDPRAPWRLRGPDVDLTLVPETVQASPSPLAPLGLHLCVAFGPITGRILDVDLTGLFGWAEELHARW